MKLVLLLLLCTLLPLVTSNCLFTSNGFKNGSDYPVVPYNTEGDYLPANYQQMLQKACGMAPIDYLDPMGKVCCNTTQVMQLTMQLIAIDASFWYCSACSANLRAHFCMFTCSPRQDEFITIHNMKPKPWSDYIDSLTYHLSYDYASSFWSSCKDDRLGQGTVESQYHTVDNFLLGLQRIKPANPSIDYDVAFSNSTTGGISATNIPCKDVCLCAYCSEACSGSNLNPDFSCRVYGIPCAVVGAILLSIVALFFLLSVAAALLQRIYLYFANKRVKSQPHTHNEEISSLLHN